MRDINFLMNQYRKTTPNRLGEKIRILLEVIEIQEQQIKALNEVETEEKAYVEITKDEEPESEKSEYTYGGASTRAVSGGGDGKIYREADETDSTS